LLCKLTRLLLLICNQQEVKVSFEKLILPPASIVSLYSKSLVEYIDVELSSEVEIIQQAKEGYSFLGNNNRSIALLVNFSEAPIIPDVHLQFLSRMLEACKLNLGDVAILNQSKQSLDIKQLKEQLRPVSLVLFGVKSVDVGLPLNFPLFKPQVYDGITYLYVPALELLNQDTEEGKLQKSKLWVCLRQLFGV
jgi:hypothetical protein